jgi:hypothetical protein
LTTGTGIVAVAAGLAFALKERTDVLLSRAHRLLLAPSSRAFAAGAALLVFVLAALFAQYCFAGQGFSGDELAQRWHARMLLTGHLFLPAEQYREFFSTSAVLDADGRWYSQFPVGGPAIMALGFAIGVPWIVNPLLAGLTARNVYRFAARAFDETTARVATLLFALSPFVLIMSGSQMNHVATLAFVTLALAELPRWVMAERRSERVSAAAIIGLAVGAAATVRPLDGALVAIVIGSFQLAAVLQAANAPQRRALAVSLLIQIAGGMLPLALLLWANARTTGAPLLFGYDSLNGPGHTIGFHADPSGALHTPLRGLIITSGYLLRLNRYLFEWPLPGVLVIVAALAALRRATRWDYLLLGLMAAVLAGYAAYWFDGFFAGPRFLYTLVPAFILFAARAPAAIADRLRHPLTRRAVLLVLPLALVYAWAVPTGVSSVQMRAYYYHVQRTKLKTDVALQLDRAKLTGAVVFVREGWRERLAARLRALDMRPADTERLLDQADACAIQTALDSLDAATPRIDDATRAAWREHVIAAARAAGRAEPVPGLQAGQHLSLVPGSRPTPACLAEATADTEGTTPFAPFLAYQTLENDRVGGPVVFARDLGPRNELLRSRFANRTWYRYRPPTGLTDSAAVFIPYDAIAAFGRQVSTGNTSP